VGKKDESKKEENFTIVLDALRSLGIEGELSGRNDIVMQEKKISGNAFQTTKDKFCHHGTLLVKSDLSVMANYLTPSSTKLSSKAVKSVASRVGNLHQANSTIDMQQVQDALIIAFCKAYGPTEINEVDFLNFPEAEANYHLFGDKETILGKTPQFTHAISHRYSWGEATVHLDIVKGVIETARVYTDCLDTSLVPVIEACLKSVPYRKEALQAIADMEQDARVQELVIFLIDQL
jgi:lipoate-protein ligase A